MFAGCAQGGFVRSSTLDDRREWDGLFYLVGNKSTLARSDRTFESLKGAE